MDSLKFTVVGDGAVGKTALLYTYKDNVFPEQYIPTVFDNVNMDIIVDDECYNMKLWDTAGQENYAAIRALSYPGTSCFLLCYSISNKMSYHNIIDVWVPELRYNIHNCTILLVGTKLDMRVCVSPAFVSYEEGLELCKRINADGFIECSAKNRDNLEAVFEEAVRCAIKKRQTKPVSNLFCPLF